MTQIHKYNVGSVRRPPGWLNLWPALRNFGEAALGVGYSYIAKEAIDARIEGRMDFCEPTRLTVGQGIDDLDDNALAGIFAYPVALSLSAAIRTGRIATAYQYEGGGELTPMRPALWQTSNPWLRYKTCAFDPADEFSESPDLPCWIWVNWADLGAVCEEIRVETDGLPHIDEMDWQAVGRGRVTCLLGRRWVGALAVEVDKFSDQLHLHCPILPDFGEQSAIMREMPAANDQAVGVVAAPASRPSKNPPHRPPKWPRSLELFAARLRDRTARPDRRVEAKAIHDAWGIANPATPETIAGHIAAFHDQTVWAGGKVTNGEEIAALIEAEKAEKGDQ